MVSRLRARRCCAESEFEGISVGFGPSLLYVQGEAGCVHPPSYSVGSGGGQTC